MIQAFTAILLSVAVWQEAIPARPDARCLSAIASAYGEPLDPLDAASVTRAQTRYSEQWRQTVELGAAEDRVIETVERALNSLRALENEGGAPPGSAELSREEYLVRVGPELSIGARQRTRFPQCEWPNTDQSSLGRRIRAVPVSPPA